MSCRWWVRERSSAFSCSSRSSRSLISSWSFDWRIFREHLRDGLGLDVKGLGDVLHGRLSRRSNLLLTKPFDQRSYFYIADWLVGIGKVLLLHATYSTGFERLAMLMVGTRLARLRGSLAQSS